MRNMFAHDYTSMDKDIVWETATKDIPHLLNFCERIIEKSALETRKTMTRSDRDSR